MEVLLTVTKRWKQSKYPLMNKWINRRWYTYTVGYYSPLTKEGPLTHAAVWMNLEDIMLSETRQSQKDKYCMVSLIWGI